MTYDFDTSSFWSSITTLFVISNILFVGFLGILRIYIWTERNPKAIWSDQSGDKFSEDNYFMTFITRAIMILV